MGLETAEFIHELNEEWPTPEDFRREGDDHFRLLKGAIKRTFPNIAGAMLLSHTQLNSLLAYIGDVEDNLIGTLNLFPVGGIILWSGSTSNVPTGWALCDGTQGTPDLRNKFVVGAGSTYNPGATGGVASHTVDMGSHTHSVSVQSHSLTTSEIPAHSHTGWKRSNFGRYGYGDSGLVSPGDTGDNGSPPEVTGTPDTLINSTVTTNPITSTTGGSGGHSHGASAASTTLATQSLDNLPPYYALAYIMKLAADAPTPVDPPA
jgi:microcystin-dependent protein